MRNPFAILQGWASSEETSLLRQLIDPERYARTPHVELLAAATLVRQAGLEHLVTEAGSGEVAALALAGERIAAEHANLFVQALRSPELVASVYDGGVSRDRVLLRAAASAAASSETRSASACGRG